jgi:glycerol-1-phosphate dehydrogenase [NAD(P)+]
MNEALAAAVRAATVTREVAVERGAIAAVPAIAGRVVPAARYLVVADEYTQAAAGAAVLAALPNADSLVLPGRPRLKPDSAVAELIAGRLAATPAVPIAVGAGVINDLVKYAASLAGRPYLCVATAASMDGYAASGAALTEHGFKRTLNCPPPVAVVADLDVIARAPAGMASWGYGDLAGKLVAGADWRLADALGEEAVNPGPLAVVQDNLPAWLADPAGVQASAPEALRGLMQGLLVSGFAMQAHGNSRPASGADHLFAHLWEMERLSLGGEPVPHGVCVGIGCVTVLALYEWLLDQPAGLIAGPARADMAAEVERAFVDPVMRKSAAAEVAAKHLAPDRVAARLGRWAEIRSTIADRLRASLLPAAELRERLRHAGAPSHPAEIGISPARLATDCRRARLIRRRYTVLDLLDELGLLDSAIASLFSPGGIWDAAAWPTTEPIATGRQT